MAEELTAETDAAKPRGTSTDAAWSAEDTRHMRRALELAARGAGHVAPNPMVGAVIVKDGRVIGEGWHERYGQPHAERNALAACTEDPRGATIYVTLEPCCHHGHQPPCTDALIQAGVARVVAAARDANPLVAGHGFELLRAAGIEVEHGLLAAESERLNAAFFKHMRTGLPLVILKYAMTLDGKTAVRRDAPARITGDAARRRVHAQRGRVGAVMVGIGTALADDPQLTCRVGEGAAADGIAAGEAPHQPIRAVVDARLRLPLGSQLVRTVGEAPLVVGTVRSNAATDPDDHAARARALEDAGAQVIATDPVDGEVDLEAFLRTLARDRGVDSVVVEGGSTLAWSVAAAGLADRVEAYVAPVLLGGADAPTPLGGAGFPSPAAGLHLENVQVERIGEDILVSGDVAGGALGTKTDASGTNGEGSAAGTWKGASPCSQA